MLGFADALPNLRGYRYRSMPNTIEEVNLDLHELTVDFTNCLDTPNAQPTP